MINFGNLSKASKFGVGAIAIVCGFEIIKSFIDKGSIKGDTVSYVCIGVLLVIILSFLPLFSKNSIKKNLIDNQGNRNKINQGLNGENNIYNKGNDNEFNQQK